MGGHPARKVFQALRIFVNDELQELEKGLQGALESLAPGGVIVVVSYHSLEDRIVKYAMKDWKTSDHGDLLTRRPLKPSEEEVEKNYKARSAKLRAFRKKY
jgi:16S rRNA (cytosine1402-N4)-methyltransferase